jgi:release factor glutamine methyltransferase
VAQDWTIKELISWTTRYFQDRGIAAARLEAEIMLAYALEEDRVFLYTYFDKPVNQQERARFRGLIQRRARQEPLAYITGEKEFMSLSFEVSPQVLIPRPETELLVETALDLCLARKLRICDMGTGSGAIAVSLAYYSAGGKVTAVDVSLPAIEVARRNAERHGVQIEFCQSDLFAEVDPAQEYDLITANLPYITAAEYETLDAGIRRYEPELALLAGGDGLDVYRRFLPEAMKRLSPGGHLLLEIGAGQGQAALDMARPYGCSQLVSDLAGKDRLIVIREESQDEYRPLEDR